MSYIVLKTWGGDLIFEGSIDEFVEWTKQHTYLTAFQYDELCQDLKDELWNWNMNLGNINNISVYKSRLDYIQAQLDEIMAKLGKIGNAFS